MRKNKPKSSAQVAQAKAATEKAIVERKKAAAAKAKASATKSTPAKPATKTVTKTTTLRTNPAPKKTVAKAPAKSTATAPAPKPVVKDSTKRESGYVHLVMDKPGGEKREASPAEYMRHKGPKTRLPKDASGYPIMPGTGGERYKQPYKKKG